MKETITIEKEVYEAVLRNSVKVADLEAENMQLRQFCEGFNTLNVAEENQQLKELLKECREYVVNTPVYPQGDNNKQAEIHRLVDKINEALK